MKNLFKKFFVLIFLLCLYIYICSYSYVYCISSDLKNNIFRLHVIANSDSFEDQKLKYQIRDNLITYINTICSNSTSKEETISIVKSHLTDFLNISNQTIMSNNFNYTSTVELGNFEFPTKSYSDISFPAGFYDALEVKIGNAHGQNWWCVLYPSLCFIDDTSGIVPDTSKKQLQNTLSSEEYQLISNNSNSHIKFKFKLIEFFNKNKLLANKT